MHTGFELEAASFAVGVAGKRDSCRIAEVFGELGQYLFQLGRVRQRMSMQIVVASAELREPAPFLGLGRPVRGVDNLGAAGSLKAQGFSLGLERLAEALALDGLHIDLPAAVR